MPDDEGSSIDKQLIEGSGSGGDESDAESKPTPVASSFSGAGAARTTGSVASGDAFLDAVKGVADDAAGVNADADVEQRPAKVDEDDQYAPAPAGHPTSSSSSSIISSSSQRRLSTSAAASTASAEPPKKPAPPPSRSSSRLSSRRHFTAEEEEEKAAAEAEAAAAAKHAADEARKKEIVAELEQLSETLKLFEREHDFFYTGLAGYGVLIGVVVFISSWAAGLSGSLSLTTGGGGGGAGGDSERQRVLKIVIAAAGVVSALFSTAQRAFSPSVRAEYYKSARDSYARLRKKVKVNWGGREFFLVFFSFFCTAKK